MKKCMIMLAMAFMAISSQAEVPSWIHTGRYAESNKELQSKANKGDRVIFLGNSITEGWVMHHPQFFKANPNFHGRGISGETTCQFLLRFRNDVLDNKPAVVVINCGTNDIALNTGDYNEDYTLGNIMSMAELAKANGIKVILTSVLPVKSYGWRTEITDAPDKICSLNNRIKEYAKANGITYVDYYT
ncbi:MAG: hypothetical protein K2I52_04150, partial [Muribaculaceae bacterium]|nr:hypothetical protein [Muribaculaceae bacterium]